MATEVDIWLVQYLCPRRHAIVALAYEPSAQTAENVEQMIRTLLARGGLNPWCGLCGSRELHFEHGKTRYRSWEEALPALREAEQDQMASRDFLLDRQRDTN